VTDAKRVAVIGLGEAAFQIHLPALAQLPNALLVGAVDPDPHARARLSKARPGVRAFHDVDAMLDETRPHWVVVASPPAQHAVACHAALARGVHVLCEKPFVERVEDAEALVAAESKGRARLCLNLEFPRMPIFEAALRRLGGRELGAPRFVQLWETVYEDPDHLAGWRKQSLTMREFGTHVLDLAVDLHGAFPERVYARMASPNPELEGDLVDVVTLDFPGGRICSVVLDRVCRGPHHYLEMRVDGEHASLRASIGGRARLELGLEVRRRRPMARVEFAMGGQAWLERGDGRTTIARNSATPFADATAAHLKSAMQAADARKRLPKDAAHALEIVRLCEAVYDSAKTGAPVDFRAAVEPAPCPPRLAPV